MIGGSVGATSNELKNKMLQRCWGWDYKAPCIYLITIVIADRRSMALARLVVDNDGGGDPAKVMAHVEPSAAGRAVEAEWRRMGELTPAIKPLEIQIMPDHIHFIVRVTERLARPLGQIIAGFNFVSFRRFGHCLFSGFLFRKLRILRFFCCRFFR